MLTINLQNVEELLLNNPNVRAILPELRHIFDQWLLTYRLPALKNLRKQTIMDCLNTLTLDHIEKLANFYKDRVTVETLDYHTVKNLTLSVNDNTEKELTKYKSYNNIAISRSADKLYISLWR